MPSHIQRSNAGKSVIGSRVELVFADQKSQTGLFIWTVGITRFTMRKDRVGQYCLQYALLHLHGEDERERVVTQQREVPDLLKTQSNTIPRTVNQYVKTQKSRAKRIN